RTTLVCRKDIWGHLPHWGWPGPLNREDHPRASVTSGGRRPRDPLRQCCAIPGGRTGCHLPLYGEVPTPERWATFYALRGLFEQQQEAVQRCREPRAGPDVGGPLAEPVDRSPTWRSPAPPHPARAESERSH